MSSTSTTSSTAIPGHEPSWQEVAARMQAHRNQTIAAISPPILPVPTTLPLNVTSVPSTLLSPEEVTITESSPEILISSLASGSLSSTTVTNAFLRRAAISQGLVNCITELLPQKSLTRAKYLDDYLSTHGKPIGPLHGLPISVKEHVGMKDLSLHAGFISWCSRIAPSDADILTYLWNAGCVFYARTTQPQTLMHLETSSNIYGETVNPYNRALTCGGSSGGEGALLGSKGSCLGVGTDIGGSIRCPAANNGCFGYKPTSYRLPMGGLAATMLGAEQIVAAIGPMSTSLEGCKIFVKAILDQEPWKNDPSLLPMPWRQGSLLDSIPKTDKRKLKIGIMRDDGVVKPHPPILRAMDKLTTALKRANLPDVEITLVDFPPLDHAEAWRIISSLYFSDGGTEETTAIDSSSEPWRPLSNFIIKENPNVRSLSINEVWKLTAEREGYRKAYCEHWNAVGGEDEIDVLLCPVGPGAAPPLDCARYWGYTSQFNLLDYPAVAFPTGLACMPEIDGKEEGYRSRNRDDEYNYRLYEPETYRDAPLSLQLVGRRYEDEKVFEALELIMKAAGLPLSK